MSCFYWQVHSFSSVMWPGEGIAHWCCSQFCVCTEQVPVVLCVQTAQEILSGRLFSLPGRKVLPWCKTRSWWSSPSHLGMYFVTWKPHSPSNCRRTSTSLAILLHTLSAKRASQLWVLQGHFIFRAVASSRKKTAWSVGSALSSQCWQQKASSFDVQAELNPWNNLYGPGSRCVLCSCSQAQHISLSVTELIYFSSLQPIVDVPAFLLSLSLMAGFFSLSFSGFSFFLVCLKSILETLVAPFSDLFWASASCCFCCQWIKQLSHHCVNFAFACRVAEPRPSWTYQGTTTKTQNTNTGT